MELPFITYNAELLAVVAPQLEAELAEQLGHKTFSEQAKAILKRLVAGQRPGIQDLARELQLSTRTLQRRLTGERTTFQRLLDEARRELASSGLSTSGKGRHRDNGDNCRGTRPRRHKCKWAPRANGPLLRVQAESRQSFAGVPPIPHWSAKSASPDFSCVFHGAREIRVNPVAILR
jgi:AraC-like DNA-binding protein